MVRSHFCQILACWNLFRRDKILPCFLARLYLDQILSGTLEELGVNRGKILANQNLARQSWVFIQDTSMIWEIFLVRYHSRLQTRQQAESLQTGKECECEELRFSHGGALRSSTVDSL